MPRSRVWITGANGLIGNYFRHVAAPARAYALLPLTRADLDLTDPRAIQRAAAQAQPDVIIHCAALTRTGACEQDPARAWKTNVEAVQYLSEAAPAAYFVLFSTDLVFDGRSGNYREDAAVNPLTVYGRTKVAAEALLSGRPQTLIIRTSLNGGTSATGDRGFNEELRRAWQRGMIPRLFRDEYRCPMAAEVTARAVWELIEQRVNGLRHVAGSERLS